MQEVMKKKLKTSLENVEITQMPKLKVKAFAQLIYHKQKCKTSKFSTSN